ncbi:MAG TPA: hypothetical protein PLY87_15265 [Planctomycetaceae bacterium]|nr:hypothetical protein [Planctomycetaceae bacterium]HQZ66448.1 hypothetical protein [Planctomycetaceae bacterium]HRA88222.1 hypothetical protein [Planctomycetaceae bacterium]
MAKRGGAGKNGIVVAQEIRAMIEANNDIKGPEVMAALREKYPKIEFNDNSCQVSFANIRKKMGLTRTLVKRPRGAKKKLGRPAAGYRSEGSQSGAAGTSVSVNFELLQAAKGLLKQCNGDATVAAQAIKQIASLQMN